MNEPSQPYSFVFLPGDGIGPEIVDVTRTVMEAALSKHELSFTFADGDIGFSALEKSGTTFPSDSLELATGADGIILGPVSHLDYPAQEAGGVNPSGALRKQLDLYANIRPAKTYQGVAAKSSVPFDLVIFRENTEGFYADRTMVAGTGEVMPTNDLAMSFRKVTRQGSERIVRAAFESAGVRRGSVTAVHKQNVLRLSDGLFLDVAREVAAEYPEIDYREELVDAMAALLIRDPAQFDVIVTTNMFGDILSDEATELSGGLGLAASLNSGHTHVMAQAQHGSAPSLAGKNVANPLSLVLSAAMLLETLGTRRDDARLSAAGETLVSAVEALLTDSSQLTADLGGHASTSEVGVRLTTAIRTQ